MKANGWNYLVLNLKEYDQVLAISNREEKFKKFVRSIKYSGFDSSAEDVSRAWYHNKCLIFTDTIGKYLWLHHLQHKKNMSIYYFGSKDDRRLYRVHESVLYSEFSNK